MPTDTFSGSDGQQLTAYSANWSYVNGDFTITGGGVWSDEDATECGARWNAASFDANQYSQLTIIQVSSGSTHFCGVGSRMASGANTYYGYYASLNERFLFKVVAGSYTALASTGTGISSGDTLRLEVNGTTLTPKLNGSTDAGLGAQTDSSIASGAAGIVGYDNGGTLKGDNWDGGDLSAGETYSGRGISRGIGRGIGR